MPDGFGFHTFLQLQTTTSGLLPYTEIDQVTKIGFYRIAGYNEEREVVTHFNPGNEPVAEYFNAPVMVNPNLLLAPLSSGWGWDSREWLFGTVLDGRAEASYWRFPFGSLATDKQILAEKFAEIRKELTGMPGYSEKLDAGLVALQAQLE